MDTSASIRSATGTITLAVLLLSLSSLALAEWDPIEDANADFTGTSLSHGAQLAVAEVMFLPADSIEAELTLLVAITVGDDMVKLYSFNTGDSTLCHEDDITVSVTGIETPIAWTPTFMILDVVDEGDESCLVIPTLTDGETGGSISVSIT